jgi:uncharacterized membrane protein
MTPILVAFAYWLHTLSTVIFIGHPVLLAGIYLPVLSNNGPALSQISKKSRSWMYGSLLVFILTGIYLLFVDSNYQGIGNFSNPWAIMMLVKHILILGMIVIGFWFNVILRVGPLMSSNSGVAQAVARFRQYNLAMAACGVIVLLLTALSQAQ